MIRLSLVLFMMIATVLMGSFIVVALTIGQDTTRPILLAALAGFLVSVPASWLVAKMILGKREA